MAQNNLAPKYSPRPTQHRSYRGNLDYIRYKFNQRHNVDGEHTRLAFNKFEKRTLAIGVVIAIGLMLLLVTTKVTSDVYQHQIVATSTSVSKFHNLNNGSRQKVSNLQRSGRLEKIAHQDHLRFSSHDVRNVK